MALMNLRNGLMTGKRTPTAKDYVQDGLVAMWDGIENAGWGTHDPNATVWKDLVGGKILQPTIMSGGNIAVFDKYFSFEKAAFSATLDGLSQLLNTSATIEIIPRPHTINSYNCQSAFGYNYSWAEGRRGINITQFRDRAYSLYFHTSNIFYLGLASVDDFTSLLLRITNGNDCECFVNGAQKGTATFSGSKYLSDRVGICVTNAVETNSRGDFAACRIYSHALTADEIAANYAVDKARFNLP